MADKSYKDFDSLVFAVERKIPEILLQDVAPIAEDILRKHIKIGIYGVYTPQTGAWVSGSTYKRRHVLESSITSSMISKDEIVATSRASASQPIVSGWSFFNNSEPGSFLEMLGSGKTGIWKNGFARPVVQSAQAEIDSSSRIKNAIRDGIKGRIG